jgi:hypothetical protein
MSHASVLEQVSLAFLILGLVSIASFPAARGFSASFGWLPFWLLALPLSAWTVARALRGHGEKHVARASANVHRLAAPRRVRTAAATIPQALRQAA